MKHNILVNLTPKGQIRLRVTFLGMRIEISTGLSYEHSKWQDGKAKPNTKNANRQTATEINNQISDMVQLIDKYFLTCDLQHVKPTSEGVKKSVLAQKDSNFLGFKEVFEEFVNEISAKRQLSTSRRRSLEWLSREIISEYPNLMVRDITTDWILALKDKFSERYKNNTMVLMQININQFVKYTNARKLTDVSLKESQVRIKHIKEDAKVYLEDYELMQFENVVLNSPLYEYIRDIFIFGCYSGLRISDLMRLNKSDIENDTITIVTKKTSKKIHIELNTHTRRIYQKYMEKYPENVRLFPNNVNRSLNIYIRQIAQWAEINKLVTISYYKSGQRIEETYPKWQLMSSHAARRTFVVQCLERNIPPIVIMKWTGHASLAAMQPYIAIVDSLKKQEMSKFDD